MTPPVQRFAETVRDVEANVATSVGNTPFVCGTSALGNLFRQLTPDEKLAICAAWFEQLPKPVVIDTAGRYGAGMALREIGRCLRELDAPPEDVIISNKLGWRQKPLVGDEPTFEPGLWKGMTHDAELAISYDGILDCWREGCEALGDAYQPRLASIHDPDEFLAAASSPTDRQRRRQQVFEAYQALNELKDQGEVDMIGVGAKDWEVICDIHREVSLDWIMFATLLTIYRHPPRLVAEVEELAAQGVLLINAGVFHSGFLVGGDYFDYRPLSQSDPQARSHFQWRAQYNELCQRHGVTPAAAAVQFAISSPGVQTVALNCDQAVRVAENLTVVQAEIPPRFWQAMKDQGLIDAAYPHLP